MKAIIDGKRYNTETATKIGGACSSGGQSDWRYWNEDLYRTKSGKLFIAGEGGALSRWSQPCGNNGRQGGSGIQPLTRDEALAWAELHLSASQVEEAFADMIEDA